MSIIRDGVFGVRPLTAIKLLSEGGIVDTSFRGEVCGNVIRSHCFQGGDGLTRSGELEGVGNIYIYGYSVISITPTSKKCRCLLPGSFILADSLQMKVIGFRRMHSKGIWWPRNMTKCQVTAGVFRLR